MHFYKIVSTLLVSWSITHMNFALIQSYLMNDSRRSWISVIQFLLSNIRKLVYTLWQLLTNNSPLILTIVWIISSITERKLIPSLPVSYVKSHWSMYVVYKWIGRRNERSNTNVHIFSGGIWRSWWMTWFICYTECCATSDFNIVGFVDKNKNATVGDIVSICIKVGILIQNFTIRLCAHWTGLVKSTSLWPHGVKLGFQLMVSAFHWQLHMERMSYCCLFTRNGVADTELYLT